MTSILLLLEEVVRQEFGGHVLTATRSAATMRSINGSSWTRVIAFATAFGEVRELAPAEVSRIFGRALATRVFREAPSLGSRFRSTRELLQSFTAVSLELMDAMLPGMTVPEVDVELRTADSIRILVRGDVVVAAFIEGFVVGLAEHFAERVTVERVDADPDQPMRHLVDVVFDSERRTGSGSPPSPPGMERRSAALGGVTTFLR